MLVHNSILFISIQLLLIIFVKNVSNTVSHIIRAKIIKLFCLSYRMYGLLLENMSEYIKQVYGEDRWEEIRRQAQVDQPSFSVHQVYPENLIPKLAKKAIQVSVMYDIVDFTCSLNNIMANMSLTVNGMGSCQTCVVISVFKYVVSFG